MGYYDNKKIHTNRFIGQARRVLLLQIPHRPLLRHNINNIYYYYYNIRLYGTWQTYILSRRPSSVFCGHNLSAYCCYNLYDRVITTLWKIDTCLRKFNNFNHSLIDQYLPFLLFNVIYHLFAHSRAEKHDCDIAFLQQLLSYYLRYWRNYVGVRGLSHPNTFIAPPLFPTNLLYNKSHDKICFYRLSK